MLAVFMYWQNKLNTLYNRSKNILPIHLRTQKLDYFRPITTICDYKEQKVSSLFIKFIPKQYNNIQYYKDINIVNGASRLHY